MLRQHASGDHNGDVRRGVHAELRLTGTRELGSGVYPPVPMFYRVALQYGMAILQQGGRLRAVGVADDVQRSKES